LGIFWTDTRNETGCWLALDLIFFLTASDGEEMARSVISLSLFFFLGLLRLLIFILSYQYTLRTTYTATYISPTPTNNHLTFTPQKYPTPALTALHFSHFPRSSIDHGAMSKCRSKRGEQQIVDQAKTTAAFKEVCTNSTATTTTTIGKEEAKPGTDLA
jgi:hypothetical protein